MNFCQDAIANLDSLAAAKDSKALAALSAPKLLQNHPHAFDFLPNGGAYGVGRYGWHAFALKEVGTGATDVVFSTPLTCEDIGEQVFRWDGRQFTAYIPEAETFGIRLASHEITAHFKPGQKWAGFVDKVQFQQTGDSSSFQFRLADHFKVQSITDTDGKPVPFASAGGVVSVACPAEKGDFTYTITYDGTVNLPQYAGSVSGDEILLAQDYWYPTVGREAAPYRLTTYTPKGWKVIGQGALISQKDAADETESVFHMELPVVYYSFSAAPFHSAADQIGKWKFSTYARDLTSDVLHAENVVQADVVAFYNDNYWPYPFQTWSTVVTNRYGGGALEAYSYATYGDFPGEDAHEPSHTWWGGILPNSYLKSEWNESFAVFSEGFFQRERELGNRGERRRAFITDPVADSSFEAAPVADGSVDIGPAAGSLGYGKGAFVLQMLEDELGKDMFLRCIHTWFGNHKPGNLEEWDGFIQAVRQTTGKDYDWFFSQWLHRPGWPRFDITNVKYAGGAVTGTVTFTGTPYRLSVEVLILQSDGQAETKRVTLERDGDFSIPATQRPTLVSFDPWQRILRNRHPDESPFAIRNILRSARRYQDPAHSDWLPNVAGGENLSSLPANLNDLVIVATPETSPRLKPLFEKAGFVVHGDQLTWSGTTIDLNKGAAFAVVDLPDGGHCCLALGKTLFEPNCGRSKVCLVDQYGRFLRGYTAPKTSGFLTAKL